MAASEDHGRIPEDRDRILEDPKQIFTEIRGRMASEPQSTRLLNAAGEGYLPNRIDSTGEPVRVCLIGHGGAGKSHLSRRLRWVLSQRDRCAVLFGLGRYNTGRTLLHTIADDRSIPRESLPRIATRQRWVFLLDGLDESPIGPGADRTAYQELLTGVAALRECPVVLTTRSALLTRGLQQVLADLGFVVVSLVEWSPGDFADFLDDCEGLGVIFPNGRDSFLARVMEDDRLSSLARTPLFARMLVGARERIDPPGGGQGQQPFRGIRNAADLYLTYTTEVFRRRPGVAEKTLRTTARAVALLMHVHGSPVLALDHNVRKIAHLVSEDPPTQARILGGNVCGILPAKGGDDTAAVRFSHMSFRDYFVAVHLRDGLRQNAISRAFGVGELSDGALGFLAELTGDQPDLVQHLATLLRTIPSVARRVRLFTGDQWNEVIGVPDSDTGVRNALLLCLRVAPGTAFERADFSALSLAAANLSGARFSQTNFSRVNLRESNLSRADLSGCDLTDAYLERADVTGTVFRGADFGFCRMSGIYVRGGLPDLRGARNLEEYRGLGADTRELIRAARDHGGEHS